MKSAPFFIAPLVLLALSACGSETSVPLPPTVNTTDTEVRITGTGTSPSPAFRIGLDGSYKAYFKAAKIADGPNDPSGCPLKADMITGQADLGYLKHLSDGAQPSTDMPGMLETRPFHLGVQKYAVSIDTPCAWQVVLQRPLAK
jgi:hypothetical protein